MARISTVVFDIGNVLDDFHVQDDIEGLAGFGELFGRDRTVIDGNARRLRVGGGDADILFGGVGADDGGAHPRDRLGQQAAAAADVENAQAFQRLRAFRVEPEILGRLVADIAQPHRVELVQRLELAGRAPPLSRHRREAVHFALVDRALCGFAHGSAPCVSHE